MDADLNCGFLGDRRGKIGRFLFFSLSLSFYFDWISIEEGEEFEIEIMDFCQS